MLEGKNSDVAIFVALSMATRLTVMLCVGAASSDRDTRFKLLALCCTTTVASCTVTARQHSVVTVWRVLIMTGTVMSEPHDACDTQYKLYVVAGSRPVNVTVAVAD